MKKIFIGGIILVCLTTCKKESSRALIHFVLHTPNHSARNAVIYSKAGSLSDPNIPLSGYDALIRADATGEFWYDNARPGEWK